MKVKKTKAPSGIKYMCHTYNWERIVTISLVDKEILKYNMKMGKLSFHRRKDTYGQQPHLEMFHLIRDEGSTN